MGSEDAKSFPPTISFPPFYFFKFLWGDDLTFFLFLFSVFTLLFAPAMMFFFPLLTKKGVVIIFQKLVTFLRSDRTIYIGTAADGKKWHKNRACKRKKIIRWEKKKSREIILIIRSQKGGRNMMQRGQKILVALGGGGVEIVGAETKKEKKRPIRKQWRNPTCKKGGTKMGDLKNNALWWYLFSSAKKSSRLLQKR